MQEAVGSWHVEVARGDSCKIAIVETMESNGKLFDQLTLSYSRFYAYGCIF
jgi:hypothetical protein